LGFISTKSDQKCFAAFIEGLLVNLEMLLVSLAHFRYFSGNDIAGWDPSNKNLPGIPKISNDLERLEHFLGEEGGGVLPGAEWGIHDGIDHKSPSVISSDMATSQHGTGWFPGARNGGSQDLVAAAVGKRESVAQPVL